MPIYRVKPGFLHGAGNQYKPGDIVDLTPPEAAGFLDKLEPVDPEPVAEEAEFRFPPIIPLYDDLPALQDQPPAIPVKTESPAPPPVKREKSKRKRGNL